jgi:hypothetical protein
MGISTMTPTEYAEHRADVQRLQGRIIDEEDELWAQLVVGQHSVCETEMTITEALALLRPLLISDGRLWPRCDGASVLIKAAIQLLADARHNLVDHFVLDAGLVDEENEA